MRPGFVRKVPAIAAALAGATPWAHGCRVCGRTKFCHSWQNAMIVSQLHTIICNWEKS